MKKLVIAVALLIGATYLTPDIAALFLRWAGTSENIRQTFETLLSETKCDVDASETRVMEFRKILASLKREEMVLGFNLDSISEKIADVVEKIAQEEFRLRKIKEHCLDGKPILAPLRNTVLSETEIEAQIQFAATKLKALRTTKAELDMERKSVNDSVTLIRRDIALGPSQLLELETALSTLKNRYETANRERLNAIDSGKGLAEAYRDAKSTIALAKGKFETISSSSIFRQVEFVDDEKIANRPKRFIDDIDVALGITTEPEKVPSDNIVAR